MNTANELLIRALEALSDAKGEIADWGAYADAYFQKKWDYEGSIKQYGPLIEEIRTYLSTTSDDAEEPVYQIAMAECSTSTAWIDVSEDVFNDAGMYGEYKRRALFLRPPKPAEPEAEYDLSQVIPLTHRKAKGIIQDKNFYITGFVLTQEDGDKCVVDMSAVRWLTGKEFFEMMHPPVVSPTAEPAARKPMTENEVGEEIWRNADEWSRNFANGFVRGIRFAEKHHGITNES